MRGDRSPGGDREVRATNADKDGAAVYQDHAAPVAAQAVTDTTDRDVQLMKLHVTDLHRAVGRRTTYIDPATWDSVAKSLIQAWRNGGEPAEAGSPRRFYGSGLPSGSAAPNEKVAATS